MDSTNQWISCLQSKVVYFELKTIDLFTFCYCHLPPCQLQRDSNGIVFSVFSVSRAEYILRTVIVFTCVPKWMQFKIVCQGISMKFANTQFVTQTTCFVFGSFGKCLHSNGNGPLVYVCSRGCPLECVWTLQLIHIYVPTNREYSLFCLLCCPNVGDPF